MNTTQSQFLYVTFIRTTPEKLWQALTQPEFTKQFFFETVQECDWKLGSSWKMVAPDGTVADSGEVLEIDPPKRLVLKWQHEYKAEAKAEPAGRMTYTLEPQADMVKLTVLHESPVPESKLIHGVSNGWPIILSSLKSFLETGESLEETRSWD